MSERMLELVAARFRTMGEPFRLRLLQVLETGERSVGDLVEALDGNQSNVSKHLRVLYEADLVTRRREGTTILYSIGDPMVFKLCELVCRNAEERTRQELEEISASSRRSRR
jgi:DNA-binding transcriptional ArsR family regulator